MACIGGYGEKMMLAGIDEQMFSCAFKDHRGRTPGPEARPDPGCQTGEEAGPGC
ncbi:MULTISPECIES: hypothetical protein [Geobacter]|uniref:hypothetical protein n=1 Tax=Geobacter TaxID=28231 RepID=UPI00257367B5|nr:hypothetical protein [Geobacter sulfurreducens]BET60142.1 hypothetical protein GEO60473_31820 [Geobacter sp. 60473]HML77565.1 hypothetical protein [Geobacter sulfurreducens]